MNRATSLLSTSLLLSLTGAGCVANVDSNDEPAPGHLAAALGDASPTSCAAVKAASPSAGDGEYTLAVQGRPTSIYCHDMATHPTEYLSLVHTGGSYNTSYYGAGQNSPGGLTTHYTKVRFYPATLTVDQSDTTFSTSAGLKLFGDTTYSTNNFAEAADCAGDLSETGTANIDLTGTPFAVDVSQFSVWGWNPSGNRSPSAGTHPVVNLTGGGYCGFTFVQNGPLQLSWSQGTSCNAIRTASPSAASGVYWLDPDGEGPNAPFQAYCDMDSEGGGWTLVLKADGESTTFAYDSDYWTSTMTYNTSHPGFDTSEAKLESFNAVPFTEMMVAMADGGAPRHLSFSLGGQHASLHEVMTAPHISTSLWANPADAANAWKSLLASPSLGNKIACASEGINNIKIPGYARVRIGITAMDDWDNCAAPESFIGIGGARGPCAPLPNTSAGNSAGCVASGGRSTRAFGYVFVR